MAEDWTLKADVKPIVDKLDVLLAGLDDRTRLHERMVIRLQGWVFRHWPTSPTLSPFTMLSRKGSAPLLDKGTLRISFTGANPTQLAQGPSTLNMVARDFGIIGSRMIGAALHNFGGTITPKQAKNLALPMTPEAKKSGSPRNFARDLFFIPARSGKATGFLAEHKAKRGSKELVRQYLLTKSVTIPARPMLPPIQVVIEECRKVAVQFILETYGGAK